MQSHVIIEENFSISYFLLAEIMTTIMKMRLSALINLNKHCVNYARWQVFHGLYFPLFWHILHSKERNIFPCFPTDTPSNILVPTIHYNDTSKHVTPSSEVTSFSSAEYFIVKILEKIRKNKNQTTKMRNNWCHEKRNNVSKISLKIQRKIQNHISYLVPGVY